MRLKNIRTSYGRFAFKCFSYSICRLLAKEKLINLENGITFLENVFLSNINNKETKILSKKGIFRE